MGILTQKRKDKVRFYSKNAVQRFLVPNAFYRAQLNDKLKPAADYDPQIIEDRVNHYNKINHPFELTSKAVCLGDISPSKRSAYYYDLRSVLRYFPAAVQFDYEFGDVRVIKDEPALVKSRPIAADNQNNVLLRLNQVRHFVSIQDNTPFRDKKELLVWRGAGWQQTRRDFLKEYWNHPLCDVGQVNPPCDIVPKEHVKSKMTIAEQLKYKFILSLEGTDVATNLKWIAQSNSLCFMRKPRMESWFMEERLIGGKHYVELQDDYADIGEKIEYYGKHSEEAEEIIQNFKNYYQMFTDPLLEQIVSLRVVDKYLKQCGQLV
ncbi:glycosyl transferase family 90 [Pontiellaceae bacterium B12227]|nr:glycosyl transferase family 90 [Pontiellaceae bacterium B12227]